jgi:hypothetical protein
MRGVFFFSHDEGMPRTRVSFRICAKKAFFTSLFVGREGRARTRSGRGESVLCLNARNARTVCVSRLDTKPKSGYSVTRNAQSREIKCRTRESAACEIENRYDVPVAKSRFPFLESQTVVFLGCFSRASGVTNSTRKCFCAYVLAWGIAAARLILPDARSRASPVRSRSRTFRVRVALEPHSCA